jgi:hypothetical protein
MNNSSNTRDKNLSARDSAKNRKHSAGHKVASLKHSKNNPHSNSGIKMGMFSPNLSNGFFTNPLLLNKIAKNEGGISTRLGSALATEENLRSRKMTQN